MSDETGQGEVDNFPGGKTAGLALNLAGLSPSVSIRGSTSEVGLNSHIVAKIEITSIIQRQARLPFAAKPAPRHMHHQDVIADLKRGHTLHLPPNRPEKPFRFLSAASRGPLCCDRLTGACVCKAAVVPAMATFRLLLRFHAAFSHPKTIARIADLQAKCHDF